MLLFGFGGGGGVGGGGEMTIELVEPPGSRVDIFTSLDMPLLSSTKKHSILRNNYYSRHIKGCGTHISLRLSQALPHLPEFLHIQPTAVW